jgi:hypothetical protein
MKTIANADDNVGGKRTLPHCWWEYISYTNITNIMVSQKTKNTTTI